MTKEQIRQYKKNHNDNKELEFICKFGRLPSVSTIEKWGKEADKKIRKMRSDIQYYVQNN